jgi:hypothetical protein
MINEGGLVVMDKETEGEKPWFCRSGPALMATLMRDRAGRKRCPLCLLLSFVLLIYSGLKPFSRLVHPTPMSREDWGTS